MITAGLWVGQQGTAVVPWRDDTAGRPHAGGEFVSGQTCIACPAVCSGHMAYPRCRRSWQRGRHRMPRMHRSSLSPQRLLLSSAPQNGRSY